MFSFHDNWTRDGEFVGFVVELDAQGVRIDAGHVEVGFEGFGGILDGVREHECGAVRRHQVSSLVDAGEINIIGI